jgi:hypothetical protein
MKKYTFEAPKRQWEKPTEPKYVFCAPARLSVVAENPQEAQEKAAQRFQEEYAGTGVLLGDMKLVAEHDLPVDWSYGYGDERKSGRTGDIGDLVGDHVIR